MHFPGQKFRPSAARENEIDRLLRDARAGSGSFARRGRHEMPMGHMLAKNTTGDELAFGQAAMYRIASLGNSDGVARADYDPRRVYLSLVAPDFILSRDRFTDTWFWGGMAIATEPIADDAFGVVAVAGVAIWSERYELNNAHRYVYPINNDFSVSDFGFARVLATDAAVVGDFSLVDLSDRKMLVMYELTENMPALPAITANADMNFGEWSTTVVDSHGIATYQKNGDKGFAEWDGWRWKILIPFCT